jgi:hypothetical protein
MPTLSLTVTYDGSDSEITQALSRMVSAFGEGRATTTKSSPSQTSTIPQSSTVLDKIASRFAGFVSRTPRLLKVVKPWLLKNGKVHLSELVKASGVTKQHDYSGIGSALTRNMKKAGGPKDWYQRHEQPNGDWIYEIADELVEPLKRAFGV